MARDGNLPDFREVGYGYPIDPEGPARRGPRETVNWRALGWVACGVVGSLLIAWFIVLSPGEIGSKAEWFFGAAVFCVVIVSMWQIVTVQRQARQDAADAEQRHRKELAAAEERAMRELAMAQRLHRTEMEARQRLHDAEMEAQREVARVERTDLRQQLQKLATIEVSRAINAQAQMLANLWNQGASILRIEDRPTREQEMNPIFEQIGQVVKDFSLELANAHTLIEDDHLHQALDRVNEAVLMAIRVAEDVHVAVVDGHMPDPNPVPGVQRLMRETAAEARHLAWELLRTGLDGSGTAKG